VLLGFSYGGFVVTGALEHIGDRVRHLVYLDAFVPGDGDTVTGIGGAEGGYGAPFWDAADRAMASPAWRYREIATNHMIPANRPGNSPGCSSS
jgi:pimeloyl-ACP methyl ester carboxylesterase